MTTKICSKCETEKSIDNYGSYIDKRNDKVKIRGICKQCRVVIEGERAKQQRPQRNESNRKWKSKNKEKIRDYERDRVRTKRQEDVQFKLCSDVSKRTINLLNAKNKNYEYKLTGCSSNQLRTWLEYQFNSHMNWSNYGEYWEIDHVIPLSLFDMVYESQQLLACNWTNVRPLECLNNKLKSNKIDKIVIFEHMNKLQSFVSLQGYQTNINSCWWQRHVLWYGKNPENEGSYDDFLKWIIRNENTDEDELSSLIV